MSNPEISSFQDTFGRIFHSKNSSPTHPPTQLSSALVGCNIGESRKQQYRIVIQEVTLESQVLEELFVIAVVSLYV